MDRTAFVEAFGRVYEHSPWIAERAFDFELGPAHDSAVGLANALARAFRSASHDERLAVLKAHPDLAGKLAAARRLTSESTEEQASAGLDALTDAERARFTELNDAYVAKHGFPFIIAVRDHDKAGILRAFEQRSRQRHRQPNSPKPAGRSNASRGCGWRRSCDRPTPSPRAACPGSRRTPKARPSSPMPTPCCRR